MTAQDVAVAIMGGIVAGALICGALYIDNHIANLQSGAVHDYVVTPSQFKVDSDPYGVEGQPWTTIGIRVMGADGKACDIVFGRENTPMSTRFLDHTTCPVVKQSGAIHGFRGYEDAAK